MDRREWLTLIYREANRFLEEYAVQGADKKRARPDLDAPETEARLLAQLKTVLVSCDSLEDLVKHSLLKNPSAELWRGEEDWDRVLTGVAAACLTHDVKGVIAKLFSGELPRVPFAHLLDDGNQPAEFKF